MSKRFRVAIVGSTGLVGRKIRQILEERNLTAEYVLFASRRSAGKTVEFLNRKFVVQELKEDSFDSGFDFAIFSAGGETARKFAPIAAANNCVVIDNSSAWRMDPNVPLVVPEVNPQAAKNHSGIIANPNCSTIQAVVALNPLHDKLSIRRIVYSTYQAVSGAGKAGVDDLENGLKGLTPAKFPHGIANNCLPQIDVFLENDYTKEEEKMIQETRKILDAPDLRITATTVRVPVLNSHSEAINLEFEKPFKVEEVKELLARSPGIIVIDDPAQQLYPLATDATGHDEVFVGRIRRDDSVENGLNIWVVADNLRKGAATNAVQILEMLMKEEK